MKIKFWLAPVLFNLFGLSAVILGFEGYLRITEKKADRLTSRALEASKGPAKENGFLLDPKLGYVPKTGSDIRDSSGLLRSGIADVANRARKKILFIGDSVTERGRILKALTNLYPNKYQFLNAGVEGYNVIQEVEFYDQFNFHEDVAEVILTFHNNDLYNVPMIYRAADGTIFFYVYGESPVVANAAWFEGSFLYRRFILFKIQKATQHADSKDLLVPQTIESLRHLKSKLAERNISLKVILFPVLKRIVEWYPPEKNSYQHAIEMLTALQIDFEDLRPTLEKGLSEHDPQFFQETLGDPWHPNDFAAELFAKFLKQKNFLEREN